MSNKLNIVTALYCRQSCDDDVQGIAIVSQIKARNKPTEITFLIEFSILPKLFTAVCIMFDRSQCFLDDICREFLYH